MFYIFLSVAPYNVTVMGSTMYHQKEQLILNCLSEGGPQLYFSWTFLGDEIANTSTLTIDNVNASNGGVYTCNVSNDAGSESTTTTVYSKFELYTLIIYTYISEFSLCTKDIFTAKIKIMDYVHQHHHSGCKK